MFQKVSWKWQGSLSLRLAAFGLIILLGGGPAHPAQTAPAAPAADYNRDRNSELIVGIPNEDISGGPGDAGAFEALYGRFLLGFDAVGEQYIHQNTSGVAEAAETGDRFAAALAAGDFNCDGYLDLAVGVPAETVPYGASTPYAGAVHFFFGNGDYLNVTAPDDYLLYQGLTGIPGPPQNDDLFGAALAAGDFNHDSCADLAVGVPNDDYDGVFDGGAVHVFFGASPNGPQGAGSKYFRQGYNSLPETAENNDNFGAALAAGDFNHDGYDDLVIAAYEETLYDGTPGQINQAGVLHVLYGSDTGPLIIGNQLLSEDDPAFDLCSSANHGEKFGLGLAAGRFDADLYADLAIGSYGDEPSYSHAGTLHIVYGSSHGLTDSGDQCWNAGNFGVTMNSNMHFSEVLAACDFNRDGFNDLAVGAPQWSPPGVSSAGAVLVAYGSATGLYPSTPPGPDLFYQGNGGLLDSAEADDYFGQVLAVGNYNGDGFCDLAVGVPAEDLSGLANAGAVQILFGALEGLSAAGNQFWYQGLNGLWGTLGANDAFGRALASLPLANHLNWLPWLRK